MTMAKFKWEVLDWIGFMFCEFTFRWFKKTDVPYDEEVWRWHHHIKWHIGNVPYKIGCFFYGLQAPPSFWSDHKGDFT